MRSSGSSWFWACICLCVCASPAWAEGGERAEGAIERADLSEAYMDDALVAQARRAGLGQAVLRAIDEPATPNDVRIALIDAAARSGNSKGMARLYARMIKARARGKALTLDELATHELLALAHMLAHDDPEALSAMGGDAEFERASPLMLVTAAVNRQRGDQAIHLVNGLIKAQQTTARPSEALCKPGACVETAMKPFSREWSVRPGAVCAAYEATRARKKGARGKLARMCGLHAKGHAKGPVYAPDATRERDTKRFAQSTPQSAAGNNPFPMFGIGGPTSPKKFGAPGAGGTVSFGVGVPVNIPPNATQGQVERLLEKALIDEMKRQDPLMGKLFEESLKMRQVSIQRQVTRTSRRPRKMVRLNKPQEITLSPGDPSEDEDEDVDGGIVVEGGDDTSGANQEIILDASED